MKTAYDIIRRPVITEQSMADTENKKYVFEVAKDATKIDIAKAVEEVFGVKVVKVNTLRVTGKLKRTGRYPAGRQPSWTFTFPAAMPRIPTSSHLSADKR